MAVPARYHEPEELARMASEFPEEVVPEADRIKIAAARLYGRGYRRTEIATILEPHLTYGMKNRTREQRRNSALVKLRRWERTQTFRDLVWEHAIIDLDMDSPNIIRAVGKRARKGRVDAARLAFELTGRHNPKGKDAAPNVQVVVANVPRPDDR